MTDLSPAAQAVMNATRAFIAEQVLADRPIKLEHITAAALRAAADQDCIKPEPLGPCDERYGNPMRTERISQQDFRYSLAKERKTAQIAAQRKLLAIAAELEGDQSPRENNLNPTTTDTP